MLSTYNSCLQSVVLKIATIPNLLIICKFESKDNKASTLKGVKSTIELKLRSKFDE